MTDEPQGGFHIIGGPPPGCCEVCHSEHEPEMPHNCQSLPYQMKFKAEHGRFPVWKDALAHCEPEVQQAWEQELRRLGHWREPEIPDCVPDGKTVGHMTTYTIEPGDTVLCDDCSEDYTESDESGGILFQSKAICPRCAPKWIERARQHGEERFIRARCPHGVPFADWVREDLR